MFKLAHFSDPHIGPLPSPRVGELLSKRVFGYANYRRNRSKALTGNVLESLLTDLKAQEPDHIALTGDLVNIALPSEITNAATWLSSVGEPHAVSLVPGNHDAYVPGSIDVAKRLWAPYFRSDSEDGRTPSTFPYVRHRGPIALVGLSSAVATPPLMATGTLGKRQIVAASNALADLARTEQFRVVLIHHPPEKTATHWHKRLTDGDLFVDMIKQVGAELILHGHTHKRSIRHLNGPNGKVPVVGVPSSSSGLTGKHEPSRYNLFEISKADDVWQCSHTERGLNAGGIFAQLDHRQLI